MVKAPTIAQFRMTFGCGANLPNSWRGDAYRYHPHGFIFRPMIYTDHNHVSGACDASVMTDPTAKLNWDHGRDASLYGSRCGAQPTPETGELVIVYRNGEWVGPDGPWRKRMRSDMATVLRLIRAAGRARNRQEKLAAAAAGRERNEQFAKASRAFAA